MLRNFLQRSVIFFTSTLWCAPTINSERGLALACRLQSCLWKRMKWRSRQAAPGPHVWRWCFYSSRMHALCSCTCWRSISPNMKSAHLFQQHTIHTAQGVCVTSPLASWEWYQRMLIINLLLEQSWGQLNWHGNKRLLSAELPSHFRYNIFQNTVSNGSHLLIC